MPDSLDPEDSLDIRTLQNRYNRGDLDPAALLGEVMARIERYPDPAVWITRFERNQIALQLDAAIARKQSGITQPLLGIPFAIKDNIDYAGAGTTAACPAYAYIAKQSAAVVQKLCDAGAIAIGKTNLDQFATGLVGTRSPYGVCKNSIDARYISGGSSSGSAVAVAAGLVSFALGTDTAGSGRVPAAFNNIVGFKPTRGVLSTRGVVPACQSLDCVSIFSLNCDDARTLFKIACGFDPADPYSRHIEDLPIAATIPRHGFRFGVPREKDLRFFGNADAEVIYHATIQRLIHLGGQRIEIDFTPFRDAASLLYAGPWVAERYLVAENLLRDDPEAILPVTRSILARGKELNAADAFKSLHLLESLRQAARAQWQKMDLLLLLPATGTIYTIEQVQANPIELNTNLGYYTNFVNLLDLAAINVPSGFQTNGLPTGVSLIAPAGLDETLLTIADGLHRSLEIGAGKAHHPLPDPAPASIDQPDVTKRVKLAVFGAHLSGLPLNHQLTEIGATLLRAGKTAPLYRFYALPGTTPPKPGLVRVEGQAGASIELEIWEMSHQAFGQFVAAIPGPLGIGMIQLDDGQQVQGFLCESYAVAGASDISSFGGWRTYLKQR